MPDFFGYVIEGILKNFLKKLVGIEFLSKLIIEGKIRKQIFKTGYQTVKILGYVSEGVLSKIFFETGCENTKNLGYVSRGTFPSALHKKYKKGW